MKKRLLLPLLVAPLVLSGCATVGPLPEFGKTTQAEWIIADFDGVAGDEYIASSNLQDIVFNQRGEVIGWYVKNYAGSPFIKKTKDGYDFTALKQERAIINMVGKEKAFVISAEGKLDPKSEAKTITPVIRAIDKTKYKQEVVFRYIQNGLEVTKTFNLNSNSFGLQLKTSIKPSENIKNIEETTEESTEETTTENASDDVGNADSNENTEPEDTTAESTHEVTTVQSTVPKTIQMSFSGLGKPQSPSVRAVTHDNDEPAGVSGSGKTIVENIRYAAMQEPPSQIAHALIVRPSKEHNVTANLLGGSNSRIVLSLPSDSTLDIYGGKNELIHLYQTGYSKLPELFQPNFFGQISLFIVKIMEMLYSSLGNWGLVIIVLTLLLRVAMWPMMQAQAKTSARMQVMQPELKALQEKYKDRKDVDSQRKMQTEMQELYKKHDVNPAGCLSAFLPMPILIALWSTVRNFEFDSGFLWMPDLAIPDPFFILAVLYLIVNLAQLYLATRKTPELFKQQLFMYAFFVYFALTFPAGVSLYLVLSTFVGVIQQWFVNKQVEAETLKVGGVGISVEPVTSKPNKKKLGK